MTTGTGTGRVAPRSGVRHRIDGTDRKGRCTMTERVAARRGDLARRMIARREELGLSVEQVAHRAGVGPAYIRYLEANATMPTWEALGAIAAALDTLPAVLLGAAAASCPEH